MESVSAALREHTVDVIPITPVLCLWCRLAPVGRPFSLAGVAIGRPKEIIKLLRRPVNGQVRVPAGGHLEVPTSRVFRGQFSGVTTTSSTGLR